VSMNAKFPDLKDMWIHPNDISRSVVLDATTTVRYTAHAASSRAPRIRVWLRDRTTLYSGAVAE
jgi:hypothetical protein